MIGNFLKLFLARKYRIGTVLVVNRENCCKERIEGTVVSVYDVSSETEVKMCGKITGTLASTFVYSTIADVQILA